MSFIKRWMSFFCLSLLLYPSPLFAEFDKEKALAGIVDLMSLKDTCIKGGTGFYIGDTEHVVTAGHMFYSKDCGELTMFLFDVLDDEYRVGTPVKYNKKADIGVIAALPVKGPSIDIPFTVMQGQYKKGDHVYIPTVDYDTSKKIIFEGTIKYTKFVSVVRNEGEIIVHNDAILVVPRSGPGTSGSPVLNEDGELIGVVFGGTDEETHVKPIKYLLELLNAK